ncbi:MAG: biopolymer transporter ExbD [Verrucomicrobiota bacterium]|jgi:biopolymer transport protein ExbD|nr:biopolymer transporter ExbD [Verrucomicrobiota bacterium]
MKLRPAEEPEANIDMTPMIDCVFLLLIFFMVSATLSKVDQTPEVKLPIAPKAAIPEAEDLRGRGVVNIVPLGTPMGASATSEDQPFIISGQLVDEKGLTDIITQRREEETDFRVYMRVDKNAEFRTVKRAIRACAHAGVFDIIFGTFQSQSAAGSAI